MLFHILSISSWRNWWVIFGPFVCGNKTMNTTRKNYFEMIEQPIDLNQYF